MKIAFINIITILLLLITSSNKIAYQIVFTQEPLETSQTMDDKELVLNPESPPGSRIVLLLPDGHISVLTPEFAAASDPCVSFDARRIIFSAKMKRDDNWDIWEMDIDGDNKRQLTRNMGDCREPEYLALSAITPPEFTDKVRWIVFSSNLANAYNEHGHGLSTSLYVMNIEPIEGKGTLVWRATFNLSNDFSPTALNDGNVLFSSWQHHGTRYYPDGMVALLTMNWSGTGLNEFYGNHEGAKLKSMACEMPDRTLVFVESNFGMNGGKLARVSFRRPLHSRELLSKDEGQYRNPHPFPDNKLAVSYKSGQNNYGIYFFDFETGKPGEKIYDSHEFHDLDAIAVVPRPEPMGRITIVIDGVPTAFLHCMNIYDSDRPEASEIKPGQVKRARFVEGVPVSASERKSFATMGSFMRTRILGEAPVEPDGSFFVHVAADTPFFIQTLDENDMALQTMRGWMWVRQGSERGCIGCHENKELAPENRLTQAVEKAIPAILTAPPEKRRTVDFRHEIMPIVENNCTSCHRGNLPAGKLDLTPEATEHFNRAYENLLTREEWKTPEQGGKYIYVGSARKSPLIHLLYGWNGKLMPHENPLSDEERKKFVEWIDIGAQWDNHSKP